MYEIYKLTRNTTWQILIDKQITNFPLDIKKLIADFGIELFSFDESKDVLQHHNIQINKEAFALKIKGKCYIFHSSTANEQRMRFSLAHELGHILSGAVKEENKIIQFSDYQETQANIFASRLLMPAIVIHHEGLKTAADIARFFNVSIESATIRLNRMKLLEERQKFETHPLERKYIKIYLKAKRLNK